mmetsp:Transcript_27372/g.36596  ORF Transcript_27372/g.36596 Transcript_27372/m.36596 type:complete len:120 (+) Transcript_27372:259-618(+)
MVVCYVGHGQWRNNSMHTLDLAQRRTLDIENCLRTCAQMNNVYVFGLFDCSRLDVGKDRAMANVRVSSQTNLVTVYRGEPQAQDLFTSQLASLPNPLDQLAQQKAVQGRLFFPEALGAL